MPIADFTDEFRRASSFDFERLKLERGERARIVLLEKPFFAYTHTLRAPKIVGGAPVMVWVERKSRGGGDAEKVQDYDMDFIGRPLCLGDDGILADKGCDPTNCPACKVASECEYVKPPERRFAANVIRYATKSDGTLVNPFGCASTVWVFGEKIFEQLRSIATEYATTGGLVGRDLILKCISGQYQSYEIIVGGQSAWTVNDEIKARVVDTYKENRIADLEAACGRRVEAAWMNSDVVTVIKRWNDASGVKASGPDGTEAAGGQSLMDGLNDLLGGTAVPPAGAAIDLSNLITPPSAALPTAAAPAQPQASSVDISDLLNETATASVIAQPAAAPASPAEPKPAEPKPADTVDFDTLLANLR